MKLIFKNTLTSLGMLFLLAGCTKSESNNMKAGGTGGTGTTGTTISLSGDPSQNQFVLASTNSEILQSDPTTGIQTSIYKFVTEYDVAGLNYASGIIYSGASDDGTHAINQQTKAQVWETPLIQYRLATAVSIFPALSGTTCYSAGDNGVIVADDAASGKLTWDTAVDPNYSGADGFYHIGALTVNDQYVITGSTDEAPINGGPNYVFVLDKSTGKFLYRYALPSGKYLSGAIKISGTTMLVPANDMIAMDITSGSILWTYPMVSRGAGTPVVSGNSVIFQGAEQIGTGGNLYSIDLASGKLNWKAAAGNDYAGVYTPVISGNYVFGALEKGSPELQQAMQRPLLQKSRQGKSSGRIQPSAQRAHQYLQMAVYFFTVRISREQEMYKIT